MLHLGSVGEVVRTPPAVSTLHAAYPGAHVGPREDPSLTRIEYDGAVYRWFREQPGGGRRGVLFLPRWARSRCRAAKAVPAAEATG